MTKSKEDIYLEQVAAAGKVDERLAKVLLSDALRKFVLNCLTVQEQEFEAQLREAAQYKEKAWMYDELSK